MLITIFEDAIAVTKMREPVVILILLILALLSSCDQSLKNAGSQAESSYQVYFERVEPEESGIYFQNTILESPELNYMIYDGIYEGAGVGIGDFNKDGFQDIILCGNQVTDKLYYNKGNFEFDDVLNRLI